MTFAQDTPGLLVETRLDGPAAAVVTADGEVDLETSPMLRDAIGDAIRQFARVHVDMRAVTFMDSTGVATLLAAAEAARREETDLSLQVSMSVRRVLELAGVDAALPIRGI
jgi:anti-sigma B factor antagonist